MAKTHAYTWRSLGNQRSIIIPVQLGVFLPIMGQPHQEELLFDTKGLIDTGATISGVSDYFAQKMKLPSFTQMEIYSLHGLKKVPVYCLDVFLPNSFTFKNMDVIAFYKAYDFDFIIGMNILRRGDMAITNANNETVFSFRIPAGDHHIDFISEHV